MESENKLILGLYLKCETEGIQFKFKPHLITTLMFSSEKPEIYNL